MPTNPQADGQTRINFQISEEEKDALQALADASGMKLSPYIRKVLEEALASQTIFETRAKVRAPHAEMKGLTIAVDALQPPAGAPPTGPEKTPAAPKKDSGPKKPQ